MTDRDVVPRAAPAASLEGASALLRALGAATRAHPVARKRLVGPDVNYGRELLAALARATGGWIGWEATNLRGIAEELAFVPLAERGLRAASDVELGALVNRAVDRAVAAGAVSAPFAQLERSLGFRRAVRDALLELRMARATADDVRRGAAAGSPAHDLPAVLEEYERLLAAGGVTDPAGIFRLAVDAFEREAPYVLDGVVCLAPSLVARGLPGELLARLRERGARVLDADTVITRDAARVELFAAATPSEELRELCRRVLAEGVRWDEVEIVATDVDAYGVALDALCQRLGIGATMLCGVPFARTRLGRALDRWLAWLEDGLPADVLRQALEAGELRDPGESAAPTALARELRALKVGWGRARYEAAVARIESGRRIAEMTRRDDETEEELAARRDSRARSGAALAALLRALLAAAPEVPERGSERPVRSSAAALARATLAWLALVPLHGMPERQTAMRLQGRLEELAAVDEGTTSFAGALAALRESLADLRAWPLLTSERKPWSAAGQMLHLTDVAHAGTTGRRRVFVVGLDADRTGGAGRQDPLLPDAARRAIAPDALATSAERRDESAHALAAALASLRGRVTLSYATSGSLDGREAGPSPLLLQAWRVAEGDATLSYEALREALLPPASAVPARDADGGLRGVLPIDARDAWLDALADGALLLDGDALVRDAFPMLASGLHAAELAAGAEATAHHGLVPDAAGHLDPTAHAGREISPSALEKLAACPLAWFYRHGLSLYLPDDPEYDAERWLDALERGSLLHELFEAFARAYAGRQHEIADDAAREAILAMMDKVVARWRDDVPPPGEAVFEAEVGELRRAALAFLRMERDALAAGDAGRWSRFEIGFGAGDTAGSYALAGGATLFVKGRADRVDELPDGTVRVVDYKTGKATVYRKSPRSGPFNGGRQLQPALYAAALEAVVGRPVSRFEYRFPTERGGNEIVAYDAAELAGAREVVAGLLEHVRTGAFIPTTDDADCAYCDYQAVCRARRGEYGTASPRATWAGKHAPTLDVYRTMLTRRAQGATT